MTAPTLCEACQQHPTRDHAPICDPCTTQLEQHLAELPALLTQLTLTETRQTHIDRGQPANRERPPRDTTDPNDHTPAWLRTRDTKIALPATPIPYNTDAADLRWETETTTANWAETFGCKPRPNPTHAVLWLIQSLNLIRVHDNAADVVDEIGHCHRAISRCIDRPPVRFFAGPCGALTVDGARCTADLYTRSRETATARCDGFNSDFEGCGVVHDMGDRRVWLVAEVDDALVALDDLFEALPVLLPELFVDRAAVRRHVARGRLVVRGVDRGGRELFRGGDVVAYLRDERVRPGPRRKAS